MPARAGGPVGTGWCRMGSGEKPHTACCGTKHRASALPADTQSAELAEVEQSWAGATTQQ